MDQNLRKRIERIASTLYGQITSEADMVFGEWMLERGKEVSIHLPENSTEEEVESAVLVVFQALKWSHMVYGFRTDEDKLLVYRDDHEQDLHFMDLPSIADIVGEDKASEAFKRAGEVIDAMNASDDTE